ncbi:MAG: hypothetical protein FJ395_19285 [Verrucomicrobia bacterium]|nr:hypothetical protein [Verrucomicrobiota bacterium]
MSHREHDVKDSLDLLLDTMCNAFGGIVLIAILVALLSNEVRRNDETHRIKELGTEMLQRRIAQVESDLAAARQYQDNLNGQLQGSSVSNATALLEQREILHGEFLTSTNNITKTQAAQGAAQEASAQSADDRARALRGQVAALSRQLTSEQNTLAATRQNVDRLQQRMTSLQTEERKNKTRNVVQLRLPKEQVQSKRTFPVIIRYDQVYFVYDTTRSRQRNTYGLEFEEISDGDIKVLPIRGRGIDLRSAVNLLHTVSNQEFYFVCWTYGDSFRTFNQFKQLITRAGFDYGWKPMHPEGFLILTDRQVTSPPPL